jgi:hypothetical protein
VLEALPLGAVVGVFLPLADAPQQYLPLDMV